MPFLHRLTPKQMPLDPTFKIYKPDTKGHEKPAGQPAVMPTLRPVKKFSLFCWPFTATKPLWHVAPVIATTPGHCHVIRPVCVAATRSQDIHPLSTSPKLIQAASNDWDNDEVYY
ncbi:hypothetical protein EDB84DRAFT_1438754 [Lactarius hengduanensis]|nr:hypothetical protein EDB84DRAFT_1438754 [Lactarius hengduanensis]